MEIEHITAPPPSQTPQARYVSLHRSIEKGIASNSIYGDLTQVCVELGLGDEALKWFAKVESSSQRFHLQNLLVRQGLMVKPDVRLQEVTEEETQNKVMDDVQEGIAFLANDHMPTTVTVTTAMFPLVVGLGGYFASGSSNFILPALAMAPALLVMMAVGALARRILVDASMGIEDAPSLPTTRKLGRESLVCAGEFLAVAAATLLPGSLILLLGLSPIAGFAVLAAGLVVLPMALTLRVIRGDWNALAPATLFPAVFRGGLGYLGRASICLAMLVPAAICWYASSNAVHYLQLALVGPLVVAPLLVSARILGRFVQTHRAEIGRYADLPEIAPKARAKTVSGLASLRGKPVPPSREPAPAPANTPYPRQNRTPPRRPAPAPQANGRQAAAPQPQRRRRPAPQPQTRQPQTRQPQAPQPQTRQPQTRQPQAHQPQTRQPQTRQPQTRRPQATRPPVTPAEPVQPRATMDEMPDLLSMPGMNVVRGEDRDRIGAAALPQEGEVQAPLPSSITEDIPELAGIPGLNVVRGEDRARAGAASRPRR